MNEWQQQPLFTLRADIGEAVAHLNTVVIGLDAVEKGYEKPEGLDISWSPDNKQAAARKARKFVVEAVMVRISEALYGHMEAIKILPRFETVTSNWTGATKRATKIWQIYEEILGENYLVTAAVLICHWRNRIVHSRSTAKLDQSQKRLLQENEIAIAQQYKGLNVDCLLCHFEEGRPTLKDLSVLIAMSLNLGKEVDRVLSPNLTKDDFAAWMNYFRLAEIIRKVRAESNPEKMVSSIRRVFKTRAPMLLQGYEMYYGDGID